MMSKVHVNGTKIFFAWPGTHSVCSVFTLSALCSRDWDNVSGCSPCWR